MVLNVKKGVFTITTGTSTQDITDVGFQPKVVILWTTYQTAAGVTDGYIFAFGAGTNRSAAIQNRSSVIESDDALVTSDSARRNADKLLTVVSDSTTPTIGFECDLTSMLSNGFQITKTTNADGTSKIVHYFCLGGDDIIDALVGQDDYATGTGTEDVTNVGFQPDFIMLYSAGAGVTALPFSASGGSIHIGAATATQQGSISVAVEDAQTTSDTWSWRRSNAVYSSILATTGAVNAILAMDSFLVDGFRVNKVDAFAAATTVFYLAIKTSAKISIGNFQITTGTGNQTVNHAEFVAQGLMLFGNHNTTEDAAAPSSEGRLSFGGANSASSEGYGSVHELDAQATIEITAVRHNESGILSLITATDTGSSSTLNLEANLDSLNLGNFVINKTTNDDTLLGWFTYILFADGGVTQAMIDNQTTQSNINIVRAKTMRTMPVWC